MANVGRPKALLVLTDDERERLTRWARRAKSPQALALRSKIVLASAEGLNNIAVAARLGVAAHTVAKWRARFVANRLDGLVDKPRPGRPATISIDQVEEVIVATLESTPKNATHWSRASMAERSGLSKSTIGRIWKTFELQPHRVEGFKFSSDPLFIEKVYDVIGLYLDPPDTAVVSASTSFSARMRRAARPSCSTATTPSSKMCRGSAAQETFARFPEYAACWTGSVTRVISSAWLVIKPP